MSLSAADRIAISEVIARYCHATDEGDGEGVADQFTEDGILETTGAWQARGRAQVAQIGAHPNKPKHWVNSIVIDGNGSTASATTYYASVRHGGPLVSTGIYESQLTKQLNGRWRLVLHRYTGDRAARLRPAPERKRDPKALTTEDRLELMELVARYSGATAERQSALAASMFVEDGELAVSGQPEVRGRAAIEKALSLQPAESARDWSTNFIIEGNADAVQLRAYYLRIRDDAVVRTGKHVDTLRKADGSFKFVRRELAIDERPK